MTPIGRDEEARHEQDLAAVGPTSVDHPGEALGIGRPVEAKESRDMLDAARELAMCGEGNQRRPGREIGIDRIRADARDGAKETVPQAGVSTNG